MNFVIILAIFLAFLVLAFPLLHLLASLSELRKGSFKKSHHIIRITFAIVLTLILLLF